LTGKKVKNKIMDIEFVPYKESLELKELGFNDGCFAKYIRGVFQFNALGGKTNFNDGSFGANIISAPTLSQSFRFFRKKYNLDSEIYMNHEYGSKFYTYLVLQLDRAIISHLSGATGKSPEHEEAELECLRKLIEIVKKKENKV